MYVTNRILVLPWILLLAVFVSCKGEDHSSIPVSIKAIPPFTYDGRIARIWGGDDFEIVDNGQLHYAYIVGIDTPKPGQSFFDEAKVKLRELTRQRKAIINVIERDELKRELCFVEIVDRETGEVSDPALDLIRFGLAWYDRSEGPHAEKYREAEEVARAEKIGIWSQPNPVPPWEFWEQKMKQFQESSN